MKKIIHTPQALFPKKLLLNRILILVIILFLIFLILWFDRDGLKDTHDGDVSLTDIIYFSAITITTVGYGDIVPVSTRARMIDVFLITPLRLIMWLLFIGTAYQMVIEKFLEEYQMKKLEKKLFNHTIICGYGSTGQAACNELILTQKDKNSIIIIDNNEDALKKAVTDGLSCIQGDATKEVFLGYSIIEKAKNIIICLGRDDSNILTCLTVKNMNPDVRIIVSIELNENMKIAQKAGADVIVLPAVAGGRLLAGACEKMYSSRFLEDLLTNNGNVSIAEHTITQDSDGSFLKDYTSQTVLAIYRSSKYISALPETKIKKDDVLIFLNNKNISKY